MLRCTTLRSAAPLLRYETIHAPMLRCSAPLRRCSDAQLQCCDALLLCARLVKLTRKDVKQLRGIIRITSFRSCGDLTLMDLS